MLFLKSDYIPDWDIVTNFSSLLQIVDNLQQSGKIIDMYLILDSASTVRVEAGSTSHLRMAAMLNGPTGGAKTIDL